MRMEDRQILKLFLARAEGAIDALANALGKQLHAMAKNILSDPQDAEECVNDTYLALWDAIPPAEPDPLSAYAFRVCRNTALKRLRSKTAQKRSGYEVSLEELAECIPDASADTLDARELGRAINHYLATLSKENRILFLRRYWFGDSIPALAQLLGIRENTASVRLSRIRAGLKFHLSKEGYDL
jgi:RNA polymerase sigma-70 factor (ECF subfamily)